MKNGIIGNPVFGLCTLILWCLAFTCCTDDCMEETGGSNYAQGREVAVCLVQAEQPVIVTRAAGGNETTLENVALFIFKADGILLSSLSQNLNGANFVNCYLPEGSAKVCAVCNAEDPAALIETVKSAGGTEQAFHDLTVTTETIAGVYREGCYVMSGSTTENVSVTNIGNPKTITVPMVRLAAYLDFTIRFDPQMPGENFKISKVTACNLPRRSRIVETEQVDTLVSCTEDAVYQDSQTGAAADYFSERLAVTRDAVDADTYRTSLRMFENRRGGITDEKGNTTYWPELVAEKDKWLRQIRKKKVMEKEGFHAATYLLIEGVYEQNQHTVYEVKYYVYVGKDNYKDFNVLRNHKYTCTVTIRSVNEVDSRIESGLISEMSIYPSLKDDEKLDAHCNATEILLYAPEAWEMEVSAPDRTPWLELSTSAWYQPAMLGEPHAQGKKASFRLSGNAGLQYVYIHTDEYVPDLDKPEDNIHHLADRQGTIRYRSGDKEWKTYTVTQQPAQLVVLEMYDANKVQWIKDVYYVERKLEKKNIEWGFLTYWSLTMDNLISTGQWDGLSNTRKLYQMALYGDKEAPPGWLADFPGDEEPAYPAYTATGILPDDVAVGYAVNKNRDRNGNGKIDYDEVLWYMPAICELQQLYEALKSYSGTDALFDSSTEKFHSSTPSAAGPDAENPGRMYYLKMADGDRSLAMRNRQYNVLCCRRRGGWRGNENAGGGGTVELPDGGWNEDHDVLPKSVTENK
ncbi:DUF4906 domain-containing protein [Phocaeicola sartorii]|uniref:DUF4906 domain-containing protein n=1 Tax=Phocaeicola sartorii TaxID=671267 RepID=UPI002586EC06|nr:DUF4906 domain-containing protein [Phocaeicola sartorii]